jgi:4-amino-4-deoxy-L-arabinose transferase-like glycosyltransferase
VSPVAWLLAVLALAAVWFGALGVRGLFAPDEGRYGLIPHEMLATGDWITPHLDALVYFEKPPLQYWTTAGFFALFGEHEWTVRLWPALTGFATLALAAAFARRRRGRGATAVVVCVLASSLLFFFFSQVTTLDMGLTFFLNGGLLCFILAAGSAQASRRWAALGWFAIALAVLSKGLVAIVLPAVTALLYAALMRDATPLRRSHPLLGALILVMVAGPWMALAQIEHPQFFDFFIIHEHFARYSTDVHHRTGAWWYFLAITVLGVMPWSPFAAGVLKRGLLARPPAGSINEDAVLVLWVCVVIVFFSLSDSKLPPYVLPAFPPLALLIAGAVCRAAPSRAAWGVAPAGVLALLIGAAGVFLVSHDVDDVAAGSASGYLPWIEGAALFLFAGAVAAAVLFKAARPAWAAAALAAGTIVGWQLALTGSVTFEEAYSGREFARAVLADVGPRALDDPWYSVGTFDNSFAFYVKRPLTLVAYQDELKFGLSLDPRRGIAGMNEFVQQWTAGGQSFAMMQPAVYEELRRRSVPMTLVARDARRVFVARAPLDSSSAAPPSPVQRPAAGPERPS